eukprot:SM000190S04876  [mRNA]  locus=s190:149063:152549:- [translate_table: standard]
MAVYARHVAAGQDAAQQRLVDLERRDAVMQDAILAMFTAIEECKSAEQGLPARGDAAAAASAGGLWRTRMLDLHHSSLAFLQKQLGAPPAASTSAAATPQQATALLHSAVAEAPSSGHRASLKAAVLGDADSLGLYLAQREPAAVGGDEAGPPCVKTEVKDEAISCATAAAASNAAASVWLHQGGAADGAAAPGWGALLDASAHQQRPLALRLAAVGDSKGRGGVRPASSSGGGGGGDGGSSRGLHFLREDLQVQAWDASLQLQLGMPTGAAEAASSCGYDVDTARLVGRWSDGLVQREPSSSTPGEPLPLLQPLARDGGHTRVMALPGEDWLLQQQQRGGPAGLEAAETPTIREPPAVAASAAATAAAGGGAAAERTVGKSPSQRGKRRCPICQAMIAAAAADCSHCGHMFRPSKWNRQQAPLFPAASKGEARVDEAKKGSAAATSTWPAPQGGGAASAALPAPWQRQQTALAAGLAKGSHGRAAENGRADATTAHAVAKVPPVAEGDARPPHHPPGPGGDARRSWGSATAAASAAAPVPNQAGGSGGSGVGIGVGGTASAHELVQAAAAQLAGLSHQLNMHLHQHHGSGSSSRGVHHVNSAAAMVAALAGKLSDGGAQQQLQQQQALGAAADERAHSGPAGMAADFRMRPASHVTQAEGEWSAKLPLPSGGAPILSHDKAKRLKTSAS